MQEVRRAVAESKAGARARTTGAADIRGMQKTARRIAAGKQWGDIALYAKGTYPPYSFHLAGLTVPA